MGGNLTRALASAAAIAGVQWAVLAYTTDPRTWRVALGMPATFAGSAIARMFAITEIVHTHGGRGEGPAMTSVTPRESGGDVSPAMVRAQRLAHDAAQATALRRHRDSDVVAWRCGVESPSPGNATRISV